VATALWEYSNGRWYDTGNGFLLFDIRGLHRMAHEADPSNTSHKRAAYLFFYTAPFWRGGVVRHADIPSFALSIPNTPVRRGDLILSTSIDPSAPHVVLYYVSEYIKDGADDPLVDYSGKRDKVTLTDLFRLP